MAERGAYHNPIGNPCVKCGKPARSHRVEHEFISDGSTLCCANVGIWLCGLPRQNHRDARPVRPGHKRSNSKRTNHERLTYIGIDGEGRGRKDHKYILLAAASETGQSWHIQSRGDKALTTVQCLDLILELPTRHTKIFSFSFNYDITKILTDLPDKLIYRFFRPELRKGFYGPLPITWCPICNDECEDDNHESPYELNLQGTKLTVKRDKKRVVIWDLFKFFQGKFLTAIKDWKVGTQSAWDRIEHMKDRRSEFDKESDEAIRNYCLEECQFIAQLAHKLIKAHEDAGLVLKSYYGAGSSGAAMLESMGIKEKLAPSNPEMQHAIACAFVGGRFENSVIGAIREPLSSWDISSAYVYQLAFLPCLEHGSWTRTKVRADLEKAESQAGALVRYSLTASPSIGSWGPFPFREKNGSISFPMSSGGGWVWLSEYLAAERCFSGVKFHEAWVYSCNCDCKPFARIPEYYTLRLKIGKEGPGIVIKLGMNSCYGKLAQSVGNAIFNSWIWAGMITSGCRAQLLTMLGLHKEMRNCLMMATDGIVTRETLTPPIPLPTGTGMTGKPLGGWEHKAVPRGMFIARPGIYYPLEPSREELERIRARGLGRMIVLQNWKLIEEAWRKDGVRGIARVANVSRFCGGKTSISVAEKGSRYNRAVTYGQWVERKIELSFNPMPKRAGVNKDGLTLELRKFPKNVTSSPYSKAVIMQSPEAVMLQAATQEMLEQPDADLHDYELSEGDLE